MRKTTAFGLLISFTIAVSAFAQSPDARLSQIVDANVTATHAYQILMQQSSGKGNASVWSSEGHSQPELQSLIDHQKSLLATDPQTVKGWVQGTSSEFDPGETSFLCSRCIST